MAGTQQRIHHGTIGGFKLRLQVMGGRSSFAVLAKIYKLFGPDLGNFIMDNANRLPELKREVMAAFGVEIADTDEETVAKYKLSFLAHALPVVTSGELLARFGDGDFAELGDMLFRQRLSINDVTVEDPNILDTMIFSPMTYGHIVLWAVACNLDPTSTVSAMLAGNDAEDQTPQRGSVSAKAS